MHRDREPRAFEHRRLAHPILRRGPFHAADLVAETTNELDIVASGKGPCPVHAELCEPARVKCPRAERPRKRAAMLQAPTRHEHRHVDAPEPLGYVRAKVES